MSIEAIPILRDFCRHQGRGPELHGIKFSPCGRSIEAVEFFGPDDGPEDLKHLRFVKPQVYMVTPEEVYSASSGRNPWQSYDVNPAAIYNLGKSEWLASFSQSHLAKCNHYIIMFYDEYLDIICEDILPGVGGYDQSDPLRV